MSLEELCRMRIKEDFDLDVEVHIVKVLEQNEIDIDLKLTSVEASFRDKNGCPGKAALTLNTWEVHFACREPIVPLLPSGVKEMGLLM